MRRTHWTIAAATLTAIALGLIGCATTQASPQLEELPLQTGSAEVTQTPSEWSAPAPMNSPAPSGRAAADVDIQYTVRKLSKNATAGAVVIDRDSGSELISQNSDRQFYAGSLVKLLVGVDALLRDPGDAAIRRRVVKMIQVSDDKICSELWMNGGGKAIISRMSDRMRLEGTEPPRTNPGQWGDSLITAHDLVRIYDYILDTAPSTIRMAMLDGMTNATEYGSDHFHQYFGIPSVFKEHWAIKQAWTDNDQAVSVHSTGLVGTGRRGDDWQYMVIVLTEHPRPQTYGIATRSVTVATQAVGAVINQ